MSHFYGIVYGQARTEATRRGSKNTGLRTVAASWDGAIEVQLVHDAFGRNTYVVREIPWHGTGQSKEIASGVIGAA